jgi:hypothetical protein
MARLYLDLAGRLQFILRSSGRFEHSLGDDQETTASPASGRTERRQVCLLFVARTRASAASGHPSGDDRIERMPLIQVKAERPLMLLIGRGSSIRSWFSSRNPMERTTVTNGSPKALAWAVSMLLATVTSVMAASPTIPSSAMPGRERERFTPSPVERFMQPRAQPAPKVVRPGPKCPASTRHGKRARGCS